MLITLLHVSQQDWWLEATPGETYPILDNSCTMSGISNLFHYQIIPFYMIMFKRNIFAKLSFVSFYMFNDHIELWIANMESPDPIKHKCIVSVYFRKQDQSAQQSLHSIPKIPSTIMSIFLPINMTSKIKEIWRKYIEISKSSESKNKRKEKHLLRNILSLRESILCRIQSISGR